MENKDWNKACITNVSSVSPLSVRFVYLTTNKLKDGNKLEYLEECQFYCMSSTGWVHNLLAYFEERKKKKLFEPWSLAWMPWFGCNRNFTIYLFEKLCFMTINFNKYWTLRDTAWTWVSIALYFVCKCTIIIDTLFIIRPNMHACCVSNLTFC